MPQDQLTPEQIAQLTAYGNALLAQTPSDARNIHPLQSIAQAFNALSGRQHLNLAEQFRAGQRNEYTQRNIVPRPSSNITTGSITPDNAEPKPQQQGFSEGEITNPEGRRMRIVRANKSGAEFTVASEYADRFQNFLNDLEGTGYNIIPDQSSGFAYRNIRGTGVRSMHADGNAIDINSILNARGRRGNMDPATMRRLAAQHGLRWGGDFGLRNGRQNPFAMDDMHFEIDPNFRPQTTPNLPVASAAAPQMPSISPGVGAGNALDVEPVTGNTPLTGRANLGMGPQAAGQVQDQANENSLVAQAQTSPDQSPNIGAIQRGNRPPMGVPDRIAPDLNIQRIERLLEMGAALSPEQVQDLTKQYQEMIQPKAIETQGGTAYYDPFSGKFMFFTPKLQTGVDTAGDVSVQSQFNIGPQGRQDLPRVPMTGVGPQQGNNTPAPQQNAPQQGAVQPNPTGAPQEPISSRLPGYIQDILRRPNSSMDLHLPEFPAGQGLRAAAGFATEYNTQRQSIASSAQEATKLVEAAKSRAAAAGPVLENLNTIRGAALTAPNLIRGQGLSDFFQRYGVYLRNIGIEIPSGVASGEIIRKLNAELASKIVGDYTNRGTNFELDTFMRNFPNLDQTFEGSLALMDYMIQLQHQNQQLGEIAGDLTTPRQKSRWNEIVTAFHDRNPTYLNIPRPDGSPGMRVYTGRINNPREAADRVQAGERFIDPTGQLRIMSAEFKRKYGSGGAVNAQ